MIKIRKTMPKKGQFIAIWAFGGKIWSEVLRWEDGKLMEYERENSNSFMSSRHPMDQLKYQGYIVLTGR